VAPLTMRLALTAARAAPQYAYLAPGDTEVDTAGQRYRERFAAVDIAWLKARHGTEQCIIYRDYYVIACLLHATMRYRHRFIAVDIAWRKVRHGMEPCIILTLLCIL
jgi:hypothetical protein